MEPAVFAIAFVLPESGRFFALFAARFEQVDHFFFRQELEVLEARRDKLLDVLVVFTALVGIGFEQLAHVSHRQVLKLLVELLVAKQFNVESVELADLEELRVVRRFQITDEAMEIFVDCLADILVKVT